MVRPATDQPSVVITRPTNRATVKGTVPVRVTATPNPHTKTPIGYVAFAIDGNTWHYDDTAPWTYDWPTTGWNDGSHTIRVDVYDNDFKTATATRTVTVDNQP